MKLTRRNFLKKAMLAAAAAPVVAEVLSESPVSPADISGLREYPKLERIPFELDGEAIASLDGDTVTMMTPGIPWMDFQLVGIEIDTAELPEPDSLIIEGVRTAGGANLWDPRFPYAEPSPLRSYPTVRGERVLFETRGEKPGGWVSAHAVVRRTA